MNLVFARRDDKVRKTLSKCVSFHLLMTGGLTWVLAAAPLTGQSPEAARITYELDEPGQVSAAVYDADGRLVRELRRGEQQDAGAHEIAWDGLNRQGEPMPAGDYEWRVLRTPGFQAEYVTSLGINPGSAHWHTWVGNHGGAASVAIDETGMYVAAASSETAPTLLKQSRDGAQRHWTSDHGITKGIGQGGLSLASDQAGTLYMLQQNGLLNVIDAPSGELRDRWDVLPTDMQRAMDGGTENRLYTHSKTAVADIDMAARGATVVVSYRQRNEVWWIDAETGDPIVKVTVPAPRGVAVAPDGEVLVISEGRVLAVARNGTHRAIIDDLAHAHRLTIDASSGHVLVAEEAPSHQVRRYTSEGKLLETYGREGGRRNGAYEPGDFLYMTDITADGRGGFLVVEERVAPRRVAHFNSGGELIDEWYGGQRYYTWGEPDPRDPTQVWFNSWHGLVLAEVDYDTGDWRVREVYELEKLGDGLVSHMHGAYGRWRVLYHEDERYLVSDRHAQVLRHREGELVPVTVLSEKKGKQRPIARALEIIDESDRDANGMRWIDDSGDGMPQADELTFIDSSAVSRANWVDDEFGLLIGGDVRERDEPTFGIRRITPTWRDGIPVYPIGDELAEVPYAAETPIPSWIAAIGRGVFRSRAGDYYAAYIDRLEKHGESWPTYIGGGARVVKWDAEGRLQWKVARHAIHGGLGAAPGITPPGRLHAPVGIIGEAHDTIIVADRVETLAMAWTSDGLYAGSFFDRRADDGLPDTVYSWWRDAEGNEAITTSDNASAGRAFQADSGTVLWFVQGRNSVPVYKIHGWNDWQRESGTVTLDDTPPHAQANGEGLHAAYYKADDLSSEPDAERVDTQIWHGIPPGEPDSGKRWLRGVISGHYMRKPTYDWSAAIEPLDVNTDFAVRWSGELEAPLTEAFTFSVYTRGAARLWIDGEQRIFAWNQLRRRWETEPIELRAGERYTVQLDYHTAHEHPVCSLNWESFSLDRQRIPQRHLYPVEIDIAEQPDARPATASINAGTFDTQSGDITRRFATGRLTDRIWGLRQRGMARRGAHLGFRRIDFGDGVSRVHVRAGGVSNGGFDITLEFRLGSPDGPTVATLILNDERGGNWTQMPERAVSVSDEATGVHDLYLVNTTTETKHGHHLLLHSFRFER
ncbi:MAG: FlgD immunoglobulin-like domain containing protein [Phycisphaeraceae bacterium]